jgi:uncharacterized protein (TIGR00251 family)
VSAPGASDWCVIRGADVLLRLRVQPRASHEGIAGERAGRLCVRVSSPPVDGAANQRLIEILARALELPRSSFEIVGGASSRDKNVLVRAAGTRHAQIQAQLQAAIAAGK